MKRIGLWCACILMLPHWAAAQRLPELAVPESYKLTFTPDFSKDNFAGNEAIQVRVLKSTSVIVLNSAEIEFQDVSITSGGATQTANVTLDKTKEQATLSVARPLGPGPATIKIGYTGILNNDMRGLYLGKDDQGRKYAATQFESTDARRAYPSFDEPAYKATFDITAIAPKGMVAISNGKIVSDTPGPGEDQHTIHFATTPKISSYLAALVVGNFEYVEGEADGIPIRVWATPGKKQLGTFALGIAEDTFKYFDHYFQIKYPYEKLDLVGLPDFSAGAMENVGCITFREVVLLLDEKHSAVELRDEVAGVITHEMAHQWFGDLVTMKWWDDIWLNEGFATWMSSKPLEAFKPEWHEELNDVRSATQALGTDSLENTRPIRQPAETPDQILELFDEIAYAKTAAVLRMLEAYLGPETFRAGVNEYLKQHAYGNATAADFWNAQTKMSHQPVDKILPTFVDQPGAPMVSVRFQCHGNSTKVTLEQQRYFYDRQRFNASSTEMWQIPVCLKAEIGGRSVQKCELVAKREDTVTLPGCADWVLGNANATGYYRSGYQSDAMKALAHDVETALSPAERIMLLSDTWASVRVGREPIGDYLTLAEGLRGDHDRAVMQQLLAQLNAIGEDLVSDPDRPAFQSWVRDLLHPELDKLGFEPKPEDNDEQNALRAHLMDTLGVTARDPEVLAAARKLTEQALQNPESVERELEFAVFRLAARNGDAALYDQILARLKQAKSPEEYYLYQSSLTEFTDPKLVERTLQYAISPEVRSQDALGVIAGVMTNPPDEKAAWDFVRSHWPQVEKAGGPFAAAEIVQVAGSFCSAGMEDEVKDFFAAHPVEAAQRTLKQSLERIKYCVDLKTQQSGQLSAWLGQRQGTTGR